MTTTSNGLEILVNNSITRNPELRAGARVLTGATELSAKLGTIPLTAYNAATIQGDDYQTGLGKIVDLSRYQELGASIADGAIKVYDMYNKHGPMPAAGSLINQLGSINGGEILENLALHPNAAGTAAATTFLSLYLGAKTLNALRLRDADTLRDRTRKALVRICGLGTQDRQY